MVIAWCLTHVKGVAKALVDPNQTIGPNLALTNADLGDAGVIGCRSEKRTRHCIIQPKEMVMIFRALLLLLATVVCLPGSAKESDRGAESDHRMEWWRDARFGMFVHWGLYSGLAGEWDGKSVGSTGNMEWIQQRVKADTDTYAASDPAVQAEARVCQRVGPAGESGRVQVPGVHHQAPRGVRTARLESQRVRRRFGAPPRPGAGNCRRLPRRRVESRLLSLGHRLAPPAVRVRRFQGNPASTARPALSEWVSEPAGVHQVSPRSSERAGQQLRPGRHPLVGLQRARLPRRRRRGVRPN